LEEEEMENKGGAPSFSLLLFGRVGSKPNSKNRREIFSPLPST